MFVRRSLVLVFVVLTALSLAAVAFARDPRDEQLRPRPADTRSAKSALIRIGDLNTGWRQDKTPRNDSTTCPGFNPDFSRFVITGKADRAFKHPAGAWLVSGTEIYESRAHAIGDFRMGARPALARCLRQMLERDVAKKDPTVDVRVLTSRMLPAPQLGERAARIQLVARFTGPAASVTMYTDVFAFQQHRTIGFLMTVSVSQPIRDGATLARVMLTRMH
jgi:hypothetical protein